jgi:hypothetical protein
MRGRNQAASKPKETNMTMPSHTCFTVRDRGEDRKPFWAIIGSAWTNKDGSFNLRLDALPVDGKIVVRPIKKDEDQAELPVG